MTKLARKDPRGGHVRLYNDLIDSPAWRVLAPTDRCLYVAMRRQLNSGNNGDISATLSQMKHYGFRSSATLSKSLRALQTLGLIAKTRETGGLTHGGLVCCLYRMTDEPTRAKAAKDIKATAATFEYRRWKTLGEAAAAIKAAHTAAKRPDHPNAARSKRKSKLQIVNAFGSESKQRRFTN